MSAHTGGHRARRRFGQNFLSDPRVIDRLVGFIAPQPGERIVEIGPGLGALTAPLISRCGSIDAVEIDRDLAERLRQRFGPALRLHEGDALQFDFAGLSEQPLRVVGNLPYNISSPLLFHLLEQAHAIRDMLLMLQKEVVDRICARPGSRDWGRLGAAVAVRAEAVRLLRIGPGAFSPRPRVESAFVRIVPRPPPFAVSDLAAYDRVTRAAFGARRKTLANALKGLVDARTLSRLGIDPGLRAEVLTPEQFARIAEAITGPPPT